MKNPFINNLARLWLNERNISHREDGPAVEYAGGDKYWCINGIQLAYMIGEKVNIKTKEELSTLIKQSIAMEKLKV